MAFFDPTKFKKNLLKTIESISLGFNDPCYWYSTSSYALNYLISGSFFKGVPLSKVTIIAGEPAAGKSYLTANIVRNAQKDGVFVILVDTENALDEKWLQALGVDTDPAKLMREQIAMVDDLAKTVSEFMKIYVSEYGQLPKVERPKVLFVVDSLGMLMVPTEKNQFDGGEVSKGDMGRLPKAMKAFVKNCVIQFAEHNIGLVATQHTYASQNQYAPDDVITGGVGLQYAASIVVTLKKGKLKEDEDGKKIKEVLGIRSKATVVKTRYNKPFEAVELKIPWSTGMDPYSGLVDLFEGQGILRKDGKMLGYTDKQGVYTKYFRNDWSDEKLDIIMRDVMERIESGEMTLHQTIVEDTDEDTDEE